MNGSDHYLDSDDMVLDPDAPLPPLDLPVRRRRSKAQFRCLGYSTTNSRPCQRHMDEHDFDTHDGLCPKHRKAPADIADLVAFVSEQSEPIPPMQAELSQRELYERIRAGIGNRLQVAKLLGIHSGTILGREKGKATIKREHWIAIRALAAQVPTEYKLRDRRQGRRRKEDR